MNPQIQYANLHSWWILLILGHYCLVIKSEASRNKRVMLSFPLFEFQVIEEGCFVCSSFMLIWKKEKNKDLVNCLNI